MIFGYLVLIILLTDLTLLGLLITYTFKLKFFLEARIAAGALIGLIILGVLMLIISSFLGLNAFSFVIFLISNFLLLGCLFRNKRKLIIEEWLDLKKRFKQLSWKLFFLFIVLVIFVFGYSAFRLLTYENGQYFVTPTHAYGDISLHLGIISSFAFGNNFPPQNPILSGTKISYPFLIDFITAIFINPLSLRFDQAVSMVGIILMATLVILLAYFSLKITGNKLAACLTLILFFFNGGLGFFYFFHDLQNNHLNFFEFIQSLPRDYTALKDLGFFWMNVVISMLLPQRSFLLGLPLAILILYIFWDLPEQFQIKKLIIGIFLVSLLPIIHAHSLVVLCPFLMWLLVLVLLKDKTKIVPIFIFCFLGLTIIFILSRLFLQQSENPLSFINLKPGWMSSSGEIFPFYIKNFGFNLVVIPLMIFFGLIKKMKLAYFTLIGQLWFILPSLYIFQPWDFDNTKLFIYWYIASILLIGYFISKMFHTRKPLVIMLGVMVIFVLTFSGMLDIIRLLSGVRYQIYSQAAIKVAEFVKNNTTSDSVFLSIDKFDNPVIALAGRKTVVGYHAWLWTYGLDYTLRDSDVRKMLIGEANKEYFKKYNISYIILFPDITDYSINEKYFQSQYKLIYNLDGYRIYQI